MLPDVCSQDTRCREAFAAVHTLIWSFTAVHLKHDMVQSIAMWPDTRKTIYHRCVPGTLKVQSFIDMRSGTRKPIYHRCVPGTLRVQSIKCHVARC